jgi:hemolysin III
MTLSEFNVALRGRVLKPGELLADGIVHLVGLIAAVVGVAVLLALTLWHGDAPEVTAVSIYSGALVAMLGCSAAYNLARSTRWCDLLKRFDHAAIFAMIAGTYTPFTTLRLEGAWADGLTAFIWSAAAIGIALRVWQPRHCEWCFVALYLVLGWVGLVAFEPLLTSVGATTFILLAIGGVLYSTGVIFHVWERLPFQRAVWHGFVVAAAGVHYAAVLVGVVIA